MAEKRVDDLIHKARNEGLELCLWHSRLVWRRNTKTSAGVKAEIMARTPEVKAVVIQEFVVERKKPGVAHKWVIRLGEAPKKSNEKCRPALLACGPSEWYMRMIRQAREFGGDEFEKKRWLILEPDQVEGIARDDRNVLVAETVKLPDGVELGGPKGSKAEIVSACIDCMVPPIDEGRIKEIIKNDE